MDILKNLPITDNHIHIDSINGLGPIKVSKEFKNAGGKVMIIPNKPAFSKNLTKPMDEMISIINQVRGNGVTAYGILGVHPAELTVMLENGIELDTAKNHMLDAIDYAKKLILEHDFFVGIGEVGRPHYFVTEKILEASNEILLYSMHTAKDIDCAVQIHAESSSESQFLEFSKMAKSVSLSPEKVIKHHSSDMVLEGEKYGIFPSITSSKPVDTAVEKSTRFLMETDYIDDVRRPGVVLGIKSVPRKTRTLLEKELIDEEKCYKIHKENVEKVYGIEIEY
ncbi:TatD-related deoxyribonuclease [Methanococcus vannielii SB]|uniref:TatD-related deoxyribonuclease n=1 Tax=Methanococcus vannielii (strain ATCC 35089 / DSM 1224 / JCM 13029 / OCM 148 / SB) TaxID=406327 RepID=A6UNM4_METVS|nr:TatD family hydrolase [Methanococcus vannielii]ABR54096.1 TatD-related deoxyribonuclease [Methanococcus vannielii SB]